MLSLNFINNRLKIKYVGESDENISKARLLFFLVAFLSFLSFFMTFIFKSSGKIPFLFIAMGFIYLGFSILVYFGKAKIVSLATSYSLSVLLSSIVFFNPVFSGFNEVYILGFMGLFAMGITSLVGFFAWQVFPMLAISTIAIFFRISTSNNSICK